MSNELAKADELIAAIQRTEDIFELLDYRDQAAGIAKIATRRRMRGLSNKAKEAEIRAEIGAGRWLTENQLAKNQYAGNGMLLADLGITKMQSSRWQKTAKEYAESPEKWDAMIAQIIARGEELSKGRLVRQVWSGLLGSRSEEWWTPREYIEAVHEVMGGIDLDPASNAEANKVVRAKKYYTAKSDGLSKRWEGRVFLNPPYGRTGPAFIGKLYESLGSGVEEAIVLVNSRSTDATWFHPMFEGIICFTDHRIDFDSPAEKISSSTHGSCFVYFGPNEEEFARVFSKFGNVVRRWP